MCSRNRLGRRGHDRDPPGGWPRPRLVVEVLYRLIEQDGIPPLGLYGSPSRRSAVLGDACTAPGTPAAALRRAPRPIPVTRPGEESGRVRK